jgi:hypothetical protein
MTLPDARSRAGPEAGGVLVMAVVAAVFACTGGSAPAHAFTNSNRIPWRSPGPASIKAGLAPAAWGSLRAGGARSWAVAGSTPDQRRCATHVRIGGNNHASY